MNKKSVYIIGDSFFNPEPNNWLEQCFSQLDYNVTNLAYGGTGFWRQFDQVTQLQYQNDFADIKYCVVGWSSPDRLYDSIEKRDWGIGNLNQTPSKHFYKQEKYQIKKQALKTLIAYRFYNQLYEYKVSRAMLEWTNLVLYKKYSHIKFINFYCVYDEKYSIVFDNQITVVPSLSNYFIKKYTNLDKFDTNHMPMLDHNYMGKFLLSIINSLDNQQLVEHKITLNL